ncbi:MAG: putative transport system permease protein [Frankiaceae bacterium]|jgi:putative ABC transport system permease protein|nr:putative transport system permease protein [Frankiaceae bacterium]
MKFSETIRTAFEAVRSHRLRSLLTMLGILIGIAAVILTVGMGQGAQAQVRDQIAKLGSNLLIVSPGSAVSSTGIRGGRGTSSTLTMADAQALGTPSVAPDIKAVAPAATSNQSLIAGSTNWTTSVVGTTPSWSEVRSRTLSSGRFIDQSDIDQAKSVVVLGSETVTQLFGGGNPVGQTVSINGSTFTVIGVLNALGATSTVNEDDVAVVPQTTYSLRVTGNTTRSTVSSIYVEATSQSTLSAAYQETNALLTTRHAVTAATADFTVSSQQSLLDTATSTDRTLTVLLAGIAAISLLVGGIGVMNIMLVSVTERVREIGLRKALGATPSAIRRQFLVEASSLGATGGVLGLGLALLGGTFLPRFLKQPVAVSPSVAAGAVAVALAIGIAAGVYPAGRAAKLAPIDALRNDH